MGVNDTPIYFRHISVLQDHRHEIYIYISLPGELIKFTLSYSIFIIVKIIETSMYAASYNSVVQFMSKFANIVHAVFV
jgi:hypothetical protein